MSQAVAAYQVYHGRFPASLEEASEHTGEKFPEKDPWGREWLVRDYGDRYELRSRGEDAGASDDDVIVVVKAASAMGQKAHYQ